MASQASRTLSQLFPPSIRLVKSFEELTSASFGKGVNAFCWQRELPTGFEEVVSHLHLPAGITHLNETRMRGLPLNPAGKAALDFMLADLTRLRDCGLDPMLDAVNGYTHPILPPHKRTDVCSWHVDSATTEADTWLCTYHGAPSEGLAGTDAIRRIEWPEAREQLLRLYGGADDENFCEWLCEHFHDLHYIPRDGAQPWSFGVGNLWRIATAWPGSPVPPCIHRAPDPVTGQKRLLLIS
jgi:hypothetical protein